MKVKVSDYIADFLVDNGIDTMFMITGGGAMHLDDSFGHKEGLHCVFNHNEQGCSVAAEGYTRLTNKLAAVCVTSGPGGTNALTGVLGGWLDSIPMFIVSGQVKRETTTWSTDVPVRQLGDQEYQIVESVKPMTKYAHMMVEANEIAYHLEKALYLSKAGRGGPVWLDVPLDIQAAIVDTDDLKHFDKSECAEEIPPKVEASTAVEILEKIKAAKRPLILAGTGIRLGDAHKEFIEVIEKLNIPVVTAWNAHDVLWDAHPLFVGRPSTVGTRGGNFAVENADLVLTLGCRLNIRQISYNYKDWAKKAFKIVVDIDKNELNKPTIFPDMKVHADVKDLLQELLKADVSVENEEHQKWLEFCQATNKKYPAVLPEYYEKKSPVNPYVFMKKLFEGLEENDIVVTGNGSACVVSFQAAEIKKGQRLFTNSGCASMGYGLPAALGACIAEGEKRVICLDGDGSLMMNLQELQTIRYNNCNMKLFVLNNNGYHSIRQTQNNLFKNGLVGVCDGNGVNFPPFDKLADTFGFRYFKIDSLDGIEEKLQEVLNTDGPVLCEAILDEAQNFAPKLSSKVLPDGKIVSPPIDDMFPFLDRAEYQANKLQ